MKGLLLFYEPYFAGAKDTEKTLNPDITEVKVIVNGIPNKIWIAADISRILNIRHFFKNMFR